ncbi:MAG: IclR family transcriptional regulator [Roseitalea sp.]|jgi:DNA-binding IclR family transcriptional regulator|nr:IclR family transcriptional regulator [Roseitalea sp.]MBO6744918.1 IclR family transcriptional regulator [Roseitalea sp.]
MEAGFRQDTIDRNPEKGRARTAPDTGTLGKAVAVLDVVARAERPMRFRDLREAIGQPPGTLHRQVSNLISEGLLQVNPDQSYGLGLRLLQFAARAWSGNRFREIAEPHLAALHEKTGETVHLGVLSDLEVIYLDKVESRQAVRMHSQIGNASPCYCTGVGKAALSALPIDDAKARIDRIAFHRHTEHTIADGAALSAELADIRAAGIAYDREEHEPGIHCVAAPIWSHDRSFVGGISVTAPSYRIAMAQLTQWADDVRTAAAAINADIEIRLGPRA